MTHKGKSSCSTLVDLDKSIFKGTVGSAKVQGLEMMMHNPEIKKVPAEDRSEFRVSLLESIPVKEHSLQNQTTWICICFAQTYHVTLGRFLNFSMSQFACL